MAKITREKFKTYEAVFDNYTLKGIIELMKKGFVLEDSLSPIKIGKEANVFSAEDQDGNKICIKIYRLETANFNQMYHYIRSDPRFIGLNHKMRKIIFAWVQREFRNLIFARKAGVRAPKAIKSHNNILLMELIGNPAPMVKDKPPKDKKQFFNAVLKNMWLLHKAGLVHGDLSKFNILNDNEKPVLIDFSHGTPPNNPLFRELLDRDAKNIANDFKVLSKEEILKKIKS